MTLSVHGGHAETSGESLQNDTTDNTETSKFSLNAVGFHGRRCRREIVMRDVSVELPPKPEVHVALGARVGLLVRVYARVDLQRVGAHEQLLADETTVLLLPGMRHHVQLQVGRGRETLLAQRTLVQLDGRVRQQVALQAAGFGEPFLTVDAAVRFFPRVGPDVRLQVPAQSELAAAEDADVRAFTRVDACMDPQRVGALEELAAERALVGLLVSSGHPPDRLGTRRRRLLAGVDLHVTGEAVRPAELFLAARAVQ